MVYFYLVQVQYIVHACRSMVHVCTRTSMCISLSLSRSIECLFILIHSRLSLSRCVIRNKPIHRELSIGEATVRPGRSVHSECFCRCATQPPPGISSRVVAPRSSCSVGRSAQHAAPARPSCVSVFLSDHWDHWDDSNGRHANGARLY